MSVIEGEVQGQAREEWSFTTVGSCLDTSDRKVRSTVLARSYKSRGAFPVVDQSTKRIAGWTDDEGCVITEGLPVVVFGDHTRALKYIDFPFARGADGTQLLRTKSTIDPLFFYYACLNLNLPSRGYNRHFTLLRESEIRVPGDVEEQRRIARALQTIQQAVELQTRSVSESEALRLGVMDHVFARGLRGESRKDTALGEVPQSWEIVFFSEIRESLRYGTSTRCSVAPAQYPVLRIPNIRSAKIDATDLKYCDLEPREAARYLLEEGDLLFIRTNGVLDRLGLCAVYKSDPRDALFASYLIRARLSPGVVPDYVAYFFGSRVGTALVASRATPAADGKYNLNTGIINSLQLPLPPEDEQTEIVELLLAIDQKIELHRAKLAALEELFQTVLRGLMTGDINSADLDVPHASDSNITRGTAE